jgi:hypothetical protein
MNTCTECDRPVRSLGLCSNHYQKQRRAKASAQKLTDRLDEVEHLIAGGVWPPHAIKRCDWSLQGAETAARRTGRHHLATTLRTHRAMLRADRKAAS